MSCVHWLNLVHVPLVMLWNDLFPSPSYLLWSIELFFLLDMIRKCFDRKPRSMASDTYEIFVEYLRSEFPVDLIALVPQIFSGMNV